MRIIHYEPLMTYAERYVALDVEPLRVTCVLREAARMVAYDPLNLDGLLGWSVVREATHGAGLPNEDVDGYAIPVPLQALWHSPQGFPLHAATPFLPKGEHARDVSYWHKRMQTGRWTKTKSGKFAPRVGAGRWMERRQPVPTVVCREWEATCIGNADEIARLLGRCMFVGKKRSIGFGEVERWRVEPGEFALVAEGALTRNLPVLAALLLDGHPLPKEPPCLVAWTEPYWKPSLWLDGWRLGTPVESAAFVKPDWFVQVPE